MTDAKTIDPVAELAAIRERGVAHLEELRINAAARKAELEAIDAEERPRIDAAEREFAAELAAKQHEIRVGDIRKAYTDHGSAYSADAANADEKVSRVNKLIAELAAAYSEAVDAELKRVESGETFRLWWKRAADPIDPSLGQPSIPAKRLVERTGPYVSVQLIARESDRDIDAKVQRLSRHSPKQFGHHYVQGQRVDD